MRFINVKLINIIVSHGIIYPTPSNLNYFWGFGSISGFLLVWQILSGVLLAFHYSPEMILAFTSIEHIMRDVINGWIIRYCHSSGASMFFIIVYIHIGRALYFRSYRKVSLWFSGIILFLVMMATAFLGYVLPWGQMSLWGATVITNLFGAFPWVGKYLVAWLWGGFSVDNPTLKRFFVLHFLLPLLLAALSILHLILLHLSGSTNPLGVANKMDIVRFYPKFIIKDIFGFFSIIGVLALFTVFFYPNALGHPDNYIRADALVTPKHIVPEWYFLPFYAILRAIPNKLGGVLAMFFAILILFLAPFLGSFKTKSSKFMPIVQVFYWLFVTDVVLLGWLGSCIVEQPYVIVSQLASVFYFSYFLLIIPSLKIIDNKTINDSQNLFWGIYWLEPSY
jgi:quinol-cytochrome oxidoreductase complex cytochrome b subunit